MIEPVHPNLVPVVAQLSISTSTLPGGTVGQSYSQTLAATLDWSYALLTEAERMVFRRLAVVRAGCPLDLAEVVCAGEGVDGADVLDLLTRLADNDSFGYTVPTVTATSRSQPQTQVQNQGQGGQSGDQGKRGGA